MHYVEPTQPFCIDIDGQEVNLSELDADLAKVVLKKRGKTQHNLAGAKVVFTGVVGASSHIRQEEASFEVIIVQTRQRR